MVNRLHLINIKPLAAVIGIEKENTNEPSVLGEANVAQEAHLSVCRQ